MAQNKSLGSLKIETDDKERVVAAVCSHGYPEDYSAIRGKRVDGIDKLLAMSGVRFFGAGLKKGGNDGKDWVANGGRLLYCVGEDDDFLKARANTIAAASSIYIEGNNADFRSDIAWRKMEKYYQRLKGRSI